MMHVRWRGLELPASVILEERGRLCFFEFEFEFEIESSLSLKLSFICITPHIIFTSLLYSIILS